MKDKSPFFEMSDLEREFWRVIDASYTREELRAVKIYEAEMERLTILTARRKRK